MNDFRYYSDSLSHHGVTGMKWGQRNGPPYPLKSFQKRAGDAVAKGKAALAKATNAAGKSIAKVYKNQAEKTKARIAEERARRKANAEDIARRKKVAADQKRLIELGKKHPELLSYDELRKLNDRANAESNFKRNYDPKKAQKAVKDVSSSLMKDVAKPALIAIGKSAAMAAFGKGDFKTNAANQLEQMWVKQQQNNKGNNEAGKEKAKETHGPGKLFKGRARKKSS